MRFICCQSVSRAHVWRNGRLLERSINARALASASALVSAPNSTSNQPLPSGRSARAFGVNTLAASGFYQDVVETLKANGLVRHDERHTIGAEKDIGPRNYQQHSFLWAFHQLAGSPQAP